MKLDACSVWININLKMKGIIYLVTFGIACVMLFFPGQVKVQIKINEFLASNTGSVIDPDYNESADWLELYNAGTGTADLSGYFLTDNFDNPYKWQIPDGTLIDAGGFLIIWADSHNTGLHTSFNISASGEELAICNASGEFIDSVSFVVQEPNISMGRKTDGGLPWVFFIKPTPGAANSFETFTGITQNVPQFSVLGGIFKTQVTLEIINTFGGETRFTLDGSDPKRRFAINKWVNPGK